MLHVVKTTGGYALYDTRPVAKGGYFVVNEAQARAAVVGGPLGRQPQEAWALRMGFAVDWDGWCVPLATCDSALYTDLV